LSLLLLPGEKESGEDNGAEKGAESGEEPASACVDVAAPGGNRVWGTYGDFCFFVKGHIFSYLAAEASRRET
jgi:hypothetical protein